MTRRLNERRPYGHRRLERVVPFLFAFLTLVAAAPATSAQEPADSLVELAALATRSVVLVDVRTPSGSRQGSGFIVDGSGTILTNQHVIRGAESMRVKLASGDLYDVVEIMSVDERRDLAVIQIAGFDLPALALGNSDSVRIGNPVVLIGSPLGLENTVTTGIISGRRQENGGFQLLQLSAPASTGSSGGPVLSRSGEVVAIATSQMPSGQNLNFALPINYARGLLARLDGEPVAVLRPTPQPADPVRTPMSARTGGVNRGLAFDVSGFGGYSVETEGRVGEDVRRTRVTYRLIETIGGGEPRIERYLESETTRRTGPFGTPQTIRRERIRTLVLLDGLEPVSTRGQIARWTGETWQEADYDLRFENYTVRGLIQDMDGRAEEIERELPPGIILREVRHLAFGTLEAGDLVGRSVELVTFDAPTGEVVIDRYDVVGMDQLEIQGEQVEAFRVNVASGLSNTTAHFRVDRPRLLLRQSGPADSGLEEILHLEVFEPQTRQD